MGEPQREQDEAPVPQRRSYAALEEVFDVLGLTAEDREELAERVRQMGFPDPVLREEIQAERLDLEAAWTMPLVRTNPARVPDPETAPSSFVETFYLPSGRLIQLRRRFPTTAELDRVLSEGTPYEEPALLIREILLPADRNFLSAELVDAFTVHER